MTYFEISLIVFMVIVLIAVCYATKVLVQKYSVTEKDKQHIWLKAKSQTNRYRFEVTDFDNIRRHIKLFSPVKCSVFKAANDVIDFDGSLIEFFIEHINAGNSAATFDVEAAKKLQASNRKFDYN